MQSSRSLKSIKILSQEDLKFLFVTSSVSFTYTVKVEKEDDVKPL